jgi:hypothetical protein
MADPRNSSTRPGGGFFDDPAQRLNWWINLLAMLFPVGRLVFPSAPVDPVPGLVFPTSAQEDTSTISAYYLSFYE